MRGVHIFKEPQKKLLIGQKMIIGQMAELGRYSEKLSFPEKRLRELRSIVINAGGSKAERGALLAMVYGVEVAKDHILKLAEKTRRVNS